MEQGPLQLMPHQDAIVQHVLQREDDRSSTYHPNGQGGLIVALPGAGKTFPMVAVARARPKPTLVICPANLVAQTAGVFLHSGPLTYSGGTLDNSLAVHIDKVPDSLGPRDVVVCSNHKVNKLRSRLGQRAALHFDRIMYDEVDCLRLGSNGYLDLMGTGITSGVRWGLTGTVGNTEGWRDALRPLAFVTGHCHTWDMWSTGAVTAAREQHFYAQFSAQVGQQGWYYIAPAAPPLDCQLDFKLVAMIPANKEEWAVMAADPGPKLLTQLVSEPSKLQKAAAAAAAAAGAAAAGAGNIRGVGKRGLLPSVRTGLLDRLTASSQGSLPGTHTASQSTGDHRVASVPQDQLLLASWLEDRILPWAPDLGTRARAEAAHLSYTAALREMADSVWYAPSLWEFMVTYINHIDHDRPVLVLCETKDQVAAMVRDFQQSAVHGYQEPGRHAVALVGTQHCELVHTATHRRQAFIQDFIQRVEEERKHNRPPPVMLATKECVAVGVDGLQDVISTMHITALLWNPAKTYQAVRRVHRRGQRALTVKVRSWVLLGTSSEDRFVKSVQRTEEFQWLHGSELDVKSTLDIPGIAGVTAATAPLNESGLEVLPPPEGSGSVGHGWFFGCA